MPSFNPAFALLALLAAAPTAQAAPRTNRNNKLYSVMSYNIGGKPGFTGYGLDNGSSCDERAAQIAQRVLDLPDQPDILIFAEATGDCYKDGLVKKLHDHNGPYKSYIYDMGAGSPKVQDSGLMFFSKFPWALPGETNLCREMSVAGDPPAAGEPTFGQAAGVFHGYSDLAASDRMMEKGIGYACVHNPSTHQVINVFFTHNQASYWKPGADLDETAHAERAVNMKEASAFIEQQSPSFITSVLGQAVIFAGDMNIYGNDIAYWVNQGDGVDHGGGWTEIESLIDEARTGMREYADNIAPGGLLSSANGLRDPWRLEATAFPPMSTFTGWGINHDLGYDYDPAVLNNTDMGFTWDGLRNGQTDGDQSRARLDYILDRQVKFNEVEDCYQHMTVERGFVYTANANVQKAYVGMDLSDHYPIRALIGPKEAMCSPSLAVKDSFAPLPVDVTNARAKKWLYYSAPGTYVLDANTPSALEVHVYAAEDLSTDLVPVEGDTTINQGTFAGDKRQNDPVTLKVKGPFYVMVSFKDPAMTGSFTLTMRKNDCASWDQAEWLAPYEAMHLAMSGPPIGNAQAKCYFKIKQDEALGAGGGVEVHALAANMENADQSDAKASFALYKSDKSLVLAGATADNATELKTKLDPSSDFQYLVLDRGGATQAMTFDVVWTRNVTTIDLKKLTVVNQDDDNDGDEVRIYWSIEDAANDVWPMREDDTTANGQLGTLMSYFYDGLASGASSNAPEMTCVASCQAAAALADSHHINIAYPNALWGMAWELDDGTPDDALFHDGMADDQTALTDGRFTIRALNPDPWSWIKPGNTDHGPKYYAKNLWADFPTYSHGYRLEATRKL